MHCAQKMTHNIYWIGSNDWTTERFENLFPIPNGVSYNSYFIDDEKTCVVDSVDAEIREEYFDNLSHLLNGRDLDYIIVNHMEPDHCQTLLETLERYPNCKMVGNATTFRMFEQFYRTPKPDQYYTVKEGDEICLGKHTLVSYTMPMVHWPEVTCTYEKSTGTLFSADAFGTFGTVNGNIFADQTDFIATYEDEARRYYTNIVGKYGAHVMDLLKKASALEIKMICPLHGPVWRKNIPWFLDKYVHWASYEPEEKGVLLVYASMYGNTESAASVFAARLAEKGMSNIHMYDVSKTDTSYLISDAFKYSHIVLASVTYNLNIYPKMMTFLDHMRMLNVQNRYVGIIENGSWACTVGTLMHDYLEDEMKGMTILQDSVTINSSMTKGQNRSMDDMVDALLDSMKEEKK